MATILQSHKKVWDKKKIIRIIYTEWYNMILRDLSGIEGHTIELGAGSGNFKEFFPDTISSDIEACDWLDMQFDAHKMPFKEKSVSNIVMVDVLHHLANPVLFLDEAARVMQKGARLAILEPFPSPFSLQVYKRFHPEPFIFDTDYFSKTEITSKDPWESNQAIAYLLFYKGLKQFRERFAHKFKIIKKKRLSYILYPASGGFENKSMIPDALIPAFQFIERMLTPLRSLLAFRTYVVLERL